MLNPNNAAIRMATILGSKFKEPRLRAELNSLLLDLGYDTELEYQTGNGPADIYLPTRRTVIETKGFGLAGPERPAPNNETQEEQGERYARGDNAQEIQWLEPDQVDALPWQAILTDGHQWWVWRWHTDADGRLAARYPYDTRSFRNGQNSEAVEWLRQLTAGTAGKPWIPNDPVRLFKPYLTELREFYERLKDEPGVRTKKALWMDMLRGSGCAPDNEVAAVDLFISHTLLVTVARAVVNTLSDAARRQSPAAAMREGFASWPQSHNEYSPTHQAGVDWTEQVFATADAYDWRRRGRDVLRTLYQDLIPAEQRKAFGEYYTPDWLAGMLAERVIDAEWMEKAVAKYLVSVEAPRGVGVLDPACGSGTFLFHAARRILQSDALQRQKVTLARQADFLCKMVSGIDIHPVAVEISRATLLRALPAEPTAGVDALQIYQGDALIYTRRGMSIANREDLPFYTIESPQGTELRVPVSFTKKVNFAENLRRLVSAAHLRQPMPAGVDAGLGEKDAKTLTAAFDTLTQICGVEGNGVWAWYITNTLAPAVLAERKIDRILANPPWVVLKQIQVEERREELEQLARNLGLYVRRGLFDIAGLFVKQCRQIYFADTDPSAMAAWVLNRAALTASNWELTRSDQAGYNREFYDLSQVKNAPFSGAAACAWIQQQPAPNGVARFILKNRDPRDKIGTTDDWGETAGAKTVLEAAPELLPAKASAYLNSRGRALFQSGFKFEPHCLVKVAGYQVLANGNLGITTALSRHEPWRSEGVQTGEVPANWVRNLALNEGMFPFHCQLEGHAGIIPLTAAGEPDPSRETNPYWAKAEAIYRRHRTLGETTPATLLGRLDYQGKLTRQTGGDAADTTLRKVLYNASGHTLRACRVEPSAIAESKLYHFLCGSADEAAYLTAILNAPCLQPAYRQSMKSDRDFVQHFWHTVPIPKYNPRRVTHRALVKACQRAEETAAAVLAVLAQNQPNMKQVGRSQRVRAALLEQGIAQCLDRLARRLIRDYAVRRYDAAHPHPWQS